jgi:hypothetical protein
MREISRDNLLRSWKEIAVYLGVDVRTCHRWEAQEGMPVHRAEGKVTCALGLAYERPVLAGIGYWNGSAMTAEPSANAAGKAGASDR